MGAFAGPKDWGRLLTAMVTPFDGEGRVDEAKVAKIAAYLVDDQQNQGIVVNGTTGESPTLSEEEKLRILEITLDTVGDRAAVVFGAGSYNTAESIHMTREGEKRGAHGIMLVNPYYNRPSQAGLEAHFATIAAETGLPVLIYNIQPRSAINLETSTLIRLAEIPNVVGVKEASGNIGQISDVIRLAPEGFRVYSGDDALTLPVLALGGYGIVSVIGHILGRQVRELVDSYPSNPKRSAEIHHELTLATKALFSSPNPVPVKYALTRKGFDCESVRLPLVTMNEAEQRIVDVAISKFL